MKGLSFGKDGRMEGLGERGGIGGVGVSGKDWERWERVGRMVGLGSVRMLEAYSTIISPNILKSLLYIVIIFIFLQGLSPRLCFTA